MRAPAIGTVDQATRTALLGNGRYKIVKSVQRPARPHRGDSIYESDTDRVLLYDGDGWIIQYEPPQNFATTITAHSGSITTVGSKTFTYRRQGGWVEWEASITITANGTGATNVHMTLPEAAAMNACIGFGRENGVTGHALTVIYASSSLAWIQKYDNTYPAGNGYVLGIAGRYRMADPHS